MKNFKPALAPAEAGGAVSRRDFLARTAGWGALYGSALGLPFPSLFRPLRGRPRAGQKLLVDKGFAAVHQIGEGLFATISDPSKGLQTVSNGGFLAGKESALLLEGFISPAGAAFQLEALRTVSQVPVRAALETHYHYDHSFGNAFYGVNQIPLWAHPAVSDRLLKSYARLQGLSKSSALGPAEGAVAGAKTALARAHREAALGTMTNLYNLARSTVLSLPNQPVDLAALPLKVDLGGITAQIEHYPGHSGTDLIVRVPDQNVVYTGDLLFHSFFPVSFDEQATIRGWRQTLRSFASWDPKTVFVPGHGRICGQEEVALFLSVFDDLEEQARKLHKSGVPAEEAADLYQIPERFKNLTIFSWDFTIAPTILKLYAEWGEK